MIFKNGLNDRCDNDKTASESDADLAPMFICNIGRWYECQKCSQRRAGNDKTNYVGVQTANYCGDYFLVNINLMNSIVIESLTLG